MNDKFPRSKVEDLTSQEQETTLEVVDNSDLGELVREISEKYNLQSFKQLAQIPIPVSSIPIHHEKISLEDKGNEDLNMLIEAIKDPATALEIPFCILGKTIQVEANTVSTLLKNTNFLFTDFDELKQTEVSFDPVKLGKVVSELKQSNDLNTLVLGHTHPVTSPDIQEGVLTSKISKDLKDKYDIKDVGLNLSLQDIYQLTFLREHLDNNIRLILLVIMHNGQKVFIENRNAKLWRLVD